MYHADEALTVGDTSDSVSGASRKHIWQKPTIKAEWQVRDAESSLHSFSVSSL